MKPIREIELRLRNKSYKELECEMFDLPIGVLLDLLNGKSRRMGDTASSLINRRDESERLAEAILEGRYTTKDGKIRAANTLLIGKADSEKTDAALLYLSRDQNGETADNALFALVALRRPRVLLQIENLKGNPEITPKMKQKVDLAIRALCAGDPRIYSPHYGG